MTGCQVCFDFNYPLISMSPCKCRNTCSKCWQRTMDAHMDRFRMVHPFRCPTPECRTALSYTFAATWMNVNQLNRMQRLKQQKSSQQKNPQQLLPTVTGWLQQYRRRKLGIRLCPNCTSPIEKNGGCNFMTCQNCIVSFCWKCLNIQDPFSSHLHSCRDVEAESREYYSHLLSYAGIIMIIGIAVAVYSWKYHPLTIQDTCHNLHSSIRRNGYNLQSSIRNICDNVQSSIRNTWQSSLKKLVNVESFHKIFATGTGTMCFWGWRIAHIKVTDTIYDHRYWVQMRTLCRTYAWIFSIMILLQFTAPGCVITHAALMASIVRFIGEVGDQVYNNHQRTATAA